MFEYYFGDDLYAGWSYGRNFSFSFFLLNFFFFFSFKRHPASKLSQYIGYCSSQETNYFWAADSNSVQYSTLCPRPVCRIVVETLKETEQFDRFSIPVAFDRAVAMFLCTLT